MKKQASLREEAVKRVNEVYESGPLSYFKGNTSYKDLPSWVTGGKSAFEMLQENYPEQAEEAVREEIENLTNSQEDSV